MSVPDDLRARMEALNRGPLSHPDLPTPEAELREKRARSVPGEVDRDCVGPSVLRGVLAGSETWSPKGSAAHVVETPVRDMDPACAAAAEGYLAEFESVRSFLATRRVRGLRGNELGPDALAFLDIETTGLSPTGPVFLIGVMSWENGDLTVRQLFARDESEERGILELCCELVAGAGLLVTFNGANFDLPYLRARASVVGIEIPEPGPHLDLLFESRRAWRQCVPNCKLQTLEVHICNRERHGDIPGHSIPSAYRNFVRTGDAREIGTIVRHNALDLVTLADLLTRLAAEPSPAPTTAPGARSRSRPGRR